MSRQVNGSKFPKPEVETIDRLQRSRILLDSHESKTSDKIFDDFTVSGKSYILVFNLSFIAESGLVKYSAGDYVSIFRSFKPNPPSNEQVTL